jgi:hypothetical protein
MAKRRTSPEDAFASRYEVNGHGCWVWSGSRSAGGYGQWLLEKTPLGNGRYSKRRIYAHRLSWELHRGAIPDGLRVLHECDNPPCVNPEHLFLGTMADNTHDMLAKGRESRGEDRPLAKLTERDVIAIRQSKETLMVLAERYGVAFQTISDVRRRKVWKHVPETGFGPQS